MCLGHIRADTHGMRNGGLGERVTGWESPQPENRSLYPDYADLAPMWSSAGRRRASTSRLLVWVLAGVSVFLCMAAGAAALFLVGVKKDPAVEATSQPIAASGPLAGEPSGVTPITVTEAEQVFRTAWDAYEAALVTRRPEVLRDIVEGPLLDGLSYEITCGCASRLASARPFPTDRSILLSSHTGLPATFIAEGLSVSAEGTQPRLAIFGFRRMSSSEPWRLVSYVGVVHDSVPLHAVDPRTRLGRARCRRSSCRSLRGPRRVRRPQSGRSLGGAGRLDIRHRRHHDRLSGPTAASPSSDQTWLVDWDGDDYQKRFDSLASTGCDVHGEAKFVMTLAPSSVLDAGCGTGRLAIELARHGVDVVGVDVDDSMLATARRLAPHIDWIHADVASLDLGRRFDVVAMAGNVPLFTPPGTQRALVAGCARHLTDDGALVTGFQLGRGYELDDYDADASDAGLTLVERFATWDRDPFQTGGDYAVSISRRARASLTLIPSLVNGPDTGRTIDQRRPRGGCHNLRDADAGGLQALPEPDVRVR